MEKIKSQKEANDVNDYLVKQTCKSFSVDACEAQKRIKGLMKSGIIDVCNGNPDDPATQLQIDVFLSIPSENYQHLMNND